MTYKKAMPLIPNVIVPETSSDINSKLRTHKIKQYQLKLSDYDVCRPGPQRDASVYVRWSTSSGRNLKKRNAFHCSSEERLR